MRFHTSRRRPSKNLTRARVAVSAIYALVVVVGGGGGGGGGVKMTTPLDHAQKLIERRGKKGVRLL